MSDRLTDLLLTISNTLLVPVIVAIFLLGAFTLHQAGGLTAEALARLRRRSAKDGERAAGQAVAGTSVARLQGRIADGEGPDKVLDDLELQVERELSRLQIGIRLGPVLGLTGTLIPLGPALGALSSGNLAALSSALIVSFTTTVLGLIIGAACFVFHTIRRGWYRQDLSDFDHELRLQS